MRNIFLAILILFLSVASYSQNSATIENTQNQNNQNQGETPKENSDSTNKSSIPEGYGNVPWGVFLSEAKDKISGRITYTDEKTIIISRESEIQYNYGFFYKEPETTDATGTETTQQKDEGKLFYVSVTFPSIDKDLIYNKLKEKYGNHTGETLKDNQGAIVWDFEKTVILMWVERYNKKPYCRKITYLSKEIAKELNEYTKNMFIKKELDVLKTLNP